MSMSEGERSSTSAQDGTALTTSWRASGAPAPSKPEPHPVALTTRAVRSNNLIVWNSNQRYRDSPKYVNKQNYLKEEVSHEVHGLPQADGGF